MTPKVTFKEKANRLLIKIVIRGESKGLYDCGMTIDPERFSEEKQVYGDPDVQAWMTSTRDELLKLFRPTMSAKQLWLSFLNNQYESTVTIRDAFKYYMDSMNLKPSSKAVYISIGHSMERKNVFDTPLTEVSPGFLRAYLNSLDLSETTRFGNLVKIKTALTRYVKDHRLKVELDFDGILKRPRYTMKENQWLTLKEVEFLMEQGLKGTQAEARDIFCLACFTGLSMSDALRFSKNDIKEINGRDFIVFNRQKTGSQCKVPIIRQAQEIIDRRKWPVKIPCRTLQYQITKLGELLGRKLNMHMSRKTAGAFFLELGFSIETTSKFLGHSNVALTQRVYAKVTQEKVEKELAEIGI